MLRDCPVFRRCVIVATDACTAAHCLRYQAHDLCPQGSADILFDAMFPPTLGFKIAAAKLDGSALPVAGQRVLSATTNYVQKCLHAHVQASDFMMAADPHYVKYILEVLKHQYTLADPAFRPGEWSEIPTATVPKPYTLPLLLHSACVVTNTLVLAPTLHTTVQLSEQIGDQGLPESVEPSQQSEQEGINFTLPLTSAGVVQHAMLRALKLITGHVATHHSLRLPDLAVDQHEHVPDCSRSLLISSCVPCKALHPRAVQQLR